MLPEDQDSSLIYSLCSFSLMSWALKQHKPLAVFTKWSYLPTQHQYRVPLPSIRRYPRPVVSHASSNHSSITPEPNVIGAQKAKVSPLSILSTKVLLRSYLISFVSTSSTLLSLSLRLLSFVAHSNSPLLNPDRNRVLRYVVKQTFYVHFCAGETPVEVKRTVDNLKAMGCDGVILGYAREVVIDEKGSVPICLETNGSCEEVDKWKRGTLEAVKLAERGDYVAVKYIIPS